MDNRLFFMRSGTAVEMNEQTYETEDRLQKILAENPHLLARAWNEKDCRLFLIQREMGVAESEDGSSCFSLDHLLVGEDGVPVLVEVKRSSDTRIRREVAGQMLDYACRAAFWNVDELREMFQKNNPPEIVEEIDTDDFWDTVSANLKTERMRLVFAADKIPDSLRVLIEFMDRSMSQIEVYGVEIREYKTADAALLSSSIVGNSLTKKSSSYKQSFRTWNQSDFEEYLRGHELASVIPAAEDIWKYAESIGMVCAFGRGGSCPSYSAKLQNQKLFEVAAYWIKAGYVCTISFSIPHLLSRLGEGWSENKLRTFLTDLPGRQEAESKRHIRSSPKNQYIDLCVFLDKANMNALQKILQDLCTAISETQLLDNVHNAHKTLTTPLNPTF